MSTDNGAKATPTGKTSSGALAKTRDSNIELFRIITMLFIVAHHYVVNSGLMAADGPVYSDPLSAFSLFYLLFGAWGKTGINCFVLITGYYMCQSHISAKKFVRLILEVMFYRIVITCIFWLTGFSKFSLMDLTKTLLPIRKIGDGFTPAFLLFYLFIPFTNVLIHHLNERQHAYLLLLCGFLYVFLGTFRPVFSVTMNYVSWFIVLYLIASYIRLYPKSFFNKTVLWGWLTAVSYALSIISVVACAWLGQRLGKNMAHFFVSDANTVLAVANGISSFMLFKNLKLKMNKWINLVAASTFGVLCIHANSDIMRQWLWKDMVNCTGHYQMPLYAVVCVILIFVICTMIDMARIRWFEPPVMRLVQKVLDRVQPGWEGVEARLFRKQEGEDCGGAR